MLDFRPPIARILPVGKLLVFLLVLFCIYLVRRALTRPPAARPGAETSRPSTPVVEKMVECAHCGLHIPESEAVAGDGLNFCCEAHHQAYRKVPNARG